MKVRIEFTNEAGEISEENVRWTDEIAEAQGMSDEEFEKMESELRSPGRYWIDAQRCAYPL